MMGALSAAATALYDKINGANSRSELEELQTAIWRVYWPGTLSDTDAQFLTEAIEKRKPSRGSVTVRPVAALHGRVSSRFTPRPRKRLLTDEERIKRRNRKRMLGGSSALPDTIRHHYTEGERAVLCIVAGEVKRHGICDLSIDEIADRAGVGRTTVQNAMHEARRQGHLQITERPRRGAKSETNVVMIVSAEWRDWIKRAPSAAHRIGSKMSVLAKKASTLKSTDITNTDSIKHQRPRIEGAFRGGTRRDSPPPHGGLARGGSRNVI
ncbi:MAG TPA: hypothetical protein VNY08_00460 [Bradyrhizobium sp.]|jgi:hypothetical protein|nr:hypothetical protein [Bradyrhizobium sp.]